MKSIVIYRSIIPHNFLHCFLQSLSSEAKVTDHKRERNGEIDYKKVELFLTYTSVLSVKYL